MVSAIEEDGQHAESLLRNPQSSGNKANLSELLYQNKHGFQPATSEVHVQRWFKWKQFILIDLPRSLTWEL